MSFSLVTPDATFTQYVDMLVPHSELASGFWLFGTDSASSLRNRAPNATVANATLTGPGTPTYGAGYIEFALPAASVGSSIDSGITPDPNADFTYIACAIANAQNICGTWHDGVNSNFLAAGATQIQTTLNGSNSLFTTATVAAGKLQFYAFSRSSTTRAVYLGSGGSLTTETAAATAGGVSNGYRIGPMGATGAQVATTLHRHAANMIFPSALTSAQVLDIYNYMKFKLPKRGITLL